MRLDIAADNPIEALADGLGLLPGGVVRVVWGLTLARTLLTAVELGVFPALDGGARTADELALTLGCDPEGLATLLGALTGFGALNRRDGRYRLTRESARYLTDRHGTNLSDALRMGEVLDRSYRQLTEVVRTGKRQDFHAGLNEEEWGIYLRGLGALARMTAAEVARALPLKDPRRLLDVAGGHAQFSVALCKRYPELQAELLDLPGGARVARELVAESPVAARVRVREGDLRQVPWGEGFDGVLLFNILHNLTEPDARAAVRRAHGALAEGGVLAILEGQHSGRTGNLSFQEAFGDIFFYALSESRTWPADTMRAWMREAGFRSVRSRKVWTLPGAALLIGVR